VFVSYSSSLTGLELCFPFGKSRGARDVRRRNASDGQFCESRTGKRVPTYAETLKSAGQQDESALSDCEFHEYEESD